MQNKLKELRKSFQEWNNSDFAKLDKIEAMEGVMGVYMIHDRTGRIIYIGSTTDLKMRLTQKLRNINTHTLTRKLAKKYPEKTPAELIKGFKFKVMPCESMEKAECLEHFAIWVLGPKYNG